MTRDQEDDHGEQQRNIVKTRERRDAPGAGEIVGAIFGGLGGLSMIVLCLCLGGVFLGVVKSCKKCCIKDTNQIGDANEDGGGDNNHDMQIFATPEINHQGRLSHDQMPVAPLSPLIDQQLATSMIETLWSLAQVN